MLKLYNFHTNIIKTIGHVFFKQLNTLGVFSGGGGERRSPKVSLNTSRNIYVGTKQSKNAKPEPHHNPFFNKLTTLFNFDTNVINIFRHTLIVNNSKLIFE